MNKLRIIKLTADYVKKELENSEKGHDWWHILRVWKNAKYISRFEKGDMFVTELGALLHDIADYKFYNGDETVGAQKAEKFLKEIGVDENVIKEVSYIISNISFKGSVKALEDLSDELKIVMDADRLDALGAIGIARTFNYGGYKNREIYNPKIKIQKYKNKEEYKNNQSTSINHFYEKLLHLKDLMNTMTAKKIALQRHKFMETYLKQFHNEWNLN